MKENKEAFEMSVSWTTRKPRENELDGVSYHFKTMAEFEQVVL